MVSIAAVIPARSGSKGVPNKNIRKGKGYPLLEWSIKACIKSKLIKNIYVSTDSQEYQNIAEKAGAKPPFLRPKELSSDTSSDYEMVMHLLNWLLENEQIPDYLVHIRPTTPIRDPDVIDKAITEFIHHPEASALRSVQKMSESAYKTFEITKKGNLKAVGSSSDDLDNSNKPRQLFPNTYLANGYVDILKTEFILKSGCIHGNLVIPFLTSNTVEIDCEDDFNYLNFLINQNPNIIKKLFS